MGLGWQELLIILVIALLLFGGTRLAGIGKASGRAIREFKEETKNLKDDNKQSLVQDAPRIGPAPTEATPPVVAPVVDPVIEEDPTR